MSSADHDTTIGAGPDNDETSGPLTAAYRLVTVALVALVTIIAYEALAVATAMPRAAAELHTVLGYGLAFSVMLTAQLLGIVLAGVWADRSGPMPAMYAGQVLFAVGAAVCALSHSFALLLVGRAVTGLGSGLVIVVLYVVVGQAYPSRMRPRVFSYISAAWVLPSLVGAPLSAWVASSFTWRLVFWIVVPPALFTLLVTHRQRAALTGGLAGVETGADTGDDMVNDMVGDTGPNAEGTAPVDRAANGRSARLGVLVALAAGALQLGTYDRFPLVSWPTLLAVLGVLGLLVVTPRLLPAGTLRMARGVPSVILSRFLLAAAFNGTITYLPLFVTQERHGSLATAGIVLAVGSLGWSAGSWIQGHPSMAGRRAALVSVGAAFLMAGCLGLVVVIALGWTEWLFAVAMVSAGLGMGLASTTLSVLLLDLVSPVELGRASAAIQLADVLGSVIGIATASAVFAALHVAGGGDIRTYLVMWSGLAGVAAVAILSGRRCRPPAVRLSRSV